MSTNTAIFTDELIPTAPFDFSKSLQFVGEFKPTRSEQIVADGALTKAVVVDGQAVAFRVWAGGSPDAPKLHYEIFAAQPTETLQAQITDRITFFLSLNDDLRQFYRIAQEDAAFAPILRQLYGYHQVKFLTPFENGCWAVLTQRTPMPIAARMKRALVENFGRSIEVNGETLWAFPSPAEVAKASVEQLTALTGNPQKADYLLNVTRAFHSVDEAWLRNGPAAAVERWLLAIRGFGPFAAAFVLLRGLGRMDTAMPHMKQFSSVIEKVYNGGKPLSQVEINRIAARYGEWQGYWMHYLRASD